MISRSTSRPGSVSPDPRAARARAARRRFILDNHPDRGGDPEEFQAGLRAFTAAGAGGGRTDIGPGGRPGGGHGDVGGGADGTRPAPTVTFYRKRGLLGRARARLVRREDANWEIANWRARAAKWKVQATRPRLGIRVTLRAGGGRAGGDARRSGTGGTPGHWRCW